MFKRQAGVKYNAKKTEVDGIRFMSSLEARFYTYFKQNKDIKIIKLQPKFLLQSKCNYFWEKIREINYLADFKIDVLWDIYILDIKGFSTTDFKLKAKMFKYKYPDERLLIVKSIKELESIIY